MNKKFRGLTALVALVVVFATGCVGEAATGDGQYYSVQNENGVIVPNKTWVTVSGYDVGNANVGGGASAILNQGKPSFVMMEPGVYLFAAYVKWEDGGDAGSGQRIVRFIREHDSTKDYFGADETVASVGKTFQGHSYPVGLTSGRRIAMQVWQDSGGDLLVPFVQFKAVKVAG